MLPLFGVPAMVAASNFLHFCAGVPVAHDTGRGDMAGCAARAMLPAVAVRQQQKGKSQAPETDAHPVVNS